MKLSGTMKDALALVPYEWQEMRGGFRLGRQFVRSPLFHPTFEALYRRKLIQRRGGPGTWQWRKAREDDVSPPVTPEKILGALVAHLRQTQSCPVCGSSASGVEDFDPAIFDFILETRFFCGAAVKVSKQGTFDIGSGCPDPLRDRLDQIEQDIADDLELEAS